MNKKSILLRSILAGVIWFVIGIIFNIFDLTNYLYSFSFLANIVESIVFAIFMYILVTRWKRRKKGNVTSNKDENI